MAEYDVTEHGRSVDVVILVIGLGALVASGHVLTDGTLWPDWLGLRWLLAGGAMLVGLGLLAGSLLRQRR